MSCVIDTCLRFIERQELRIIRQDTVQEGGNTRHTAAKKTIETYRSKVRIFCDWLDYYGYADNDITTITNDIVLDFFDFLIKDQKTCRRYNKKIGRC